MGRTLKLCLIEQTILPQLDFLLHALASLTPPGNDLVVPDEMLAESRRVFADLRRVLGATPLQVTEPTAPVTRGALHAVLRDALSTFVLFDDVVNRKAPLAQAKKEREIQRLEESSAHLSPRPFPRIE